MLREGGEQDEQLVAQGLPVGAEPGQNRQDGGGDEEVEAQGPASHPPQHGQPRSEESLFFAPEGRKGRQRQNLTSEPASVSPTDELDKLITDRPESCRRKPLDPGMTRLPGCPAGLPLAIPTQVQAPPIVTLSLPCLPMHQHHQLQAQLQAQARLAPMSPAPAQTPPLHTVPDLSHSPLTQQPGKPPDDFYSVHSDTHTEVDALDPSIMDFALQGI